MKQSFNEHIFVLGRNSDLSSSEIKSVAVWFCKGGFQLFQDGSSILRIQSKLTDSEAIKFFNLLGGSIKVCKVLPPDFDLSSLIEKGRNRFAVSSYNTNKEHTELHSKLLKNSRRMLKDIAKEKGVRIRYIGKDNVPISSGQVTGTDLLKYGFELVYFQDAGDNTRHAQTLAVQNIEEFSKRDYEKPYTNLDMGVLPPKLARIMINLASCRPGSTIWDPFCGSGAIVTEGLMMGYDMIGSDIDPEAVEGTEKNIRWLSRNYSLNEARYTVVEQDVTQISRSFQRTLRNTSIQAVVFEPYMGPPLKRVISVKFANELLSDVSTLYSALLDVLGRIRKPGLKVVAVFPSYRTTKGWLTLRYSEVFPSKWKIGNISTEEGDLRWDRSNSIIRRNLVVARLKH